MTETKLICRRLTLSWSRHGKASPLERVQRVPSAHRWSAGRASQCDSATTQCTPRSISKEPKQARTKAEVVTPSVFLASNAPCLRLGAGAECPDQLLIGQAASDNLPHDFAEPIRSAITATLPAKLRPGSDADRL